MLTSQDNIGDSVYYKKSIVMVPHNIGDKNTDFTGDNVSSGSKRNMSDIPILSCLSFPTKNNSLSHRN